jgi:transcriptional regulator with XRE-family HTH domain
MTRAKQRRRSMSESEISVLLGVAMRGLREEHGLTQADVGAVLNVHQATVSAIELGQRCASFYEAQALEEHLGLPYGTLQRRAGLLRDDVTLRQRVLSEPNRTTEQKQVIVAGLDAAMRSPRVRR